MTSDREALLAAIAAHPEEDTPRLICADWLDEYGDPDRADFIRLQIEIERGVELRTGNPLPPELTTQKSKRADQLLSLHKDKWEGHICRPELGVKSVTFSRGFPQSLTVSNFERFSNNVEKIFTNEQTITNLNLAANGINEFGAQALAECSHLQHLRKLDLAGNHISDAGVATLVGKNSQLRNLTTLNVSMNGIGDTGAQSLAASPHLQHLTKLSLAGNRRISGVGVRALAASSYFSEDTNIVVREFNGTLTQLRTALARHGPAGDSYGGRT